MYSNKIYTDRMISSLHASIDGSYSLEEEILSKKCDLITSHEPVYVP